MRILLPTSLLLLASATPATGQTSVEAAIDALATQAIEDGLSVGLAVGTLRGEERWTRGYGLVSVEGVAVPDASTVYEIGSITKAFVGVLLADAVAQGHVALEDPVARHLPDGTSVPQQEGSSIHLVHLATHTSGLPRIPKLQPENPWDPYASFHEQELFEALATTELLTVPGEHYAYSNYGFGLLGHVVARAQDAELEALLVARVCDPLGMDDTRMTPTEEMTARLAPPYNALQRPTHSWHFDALAGAGAIRSTTADMLVWAAANLEPGDTPLGRSIADSHAPRHDTEGGGAVALGWHIGQDGRTVWHNGGTGGYRSFLAIDPTVPCAVVVLANTTHPDVDRLGTDLLERIRGTD